MKRHGLVYISLLILVLSYLLCRFVFLDIHGIKQWPDFLACLGGIILIFTGVIKLKYTPVMVSLGYIVGFVFGEIFHTESIDPGAGATDNLWSIWTISYFIIIFIGLIVDFARKRKSIGK